jgi:hypothetical protein
VSLHRTALLIFQHAPDDLPAQHRIGALRHCLPYGSRYNVIDGLCLRARVRSGTLQNSLNQLALSRIQKTLIGNQTLGETAENFVGVHKHTPAQILSDQGP